MNRREFLKSIGISAITLTIPNLLNAVNSDKKDLEKKLKGASTLPGGSNIPTSASNEHSPRSIIGVTHTLYMHKDSNIGYVLKWHDDGFYVALTREPTEKEFKDIDKQINPGLEGKFTGEENNRYLVTNKIISRWTGDAIFNSEVMPDDYKGELPVNKTKKQLRKKYAKVYGYFSDDFESFNKVNLKTKEVIEVLPINQETGTTDAIYAKAKAFTNFVDTYDENMIGIEYCSKGDAVKDVFYPKKRIRRKFKKL